MPRWRISARHARSHWWGVRPGAGRCGRTSSVTADQSGGVFPAVLTACASTSCTFPSIPASASGTPPGTDRPPGPDMVVLRVGASIPARRIRRRPPLRPIPRAGISACAVPRSGCGLDVRVQRFTLQAVCDRHTHLARSPPSRRTLFARASSALRPQQASAAALAAFSRTQGTYGRRRSKIWVGHVRLHVSTAGLAAELHPCYTRMPSSLARASTFSIVASVAGSPGAPRLCAVLRAWRTTSSKCWFSSAAATRSLSLSCLLTDCSL